MTKEQLQELAFYMRDSARAEVYDQIFPAIRELIDRGGEIRITSNGIFKE